MNDEKIREILGSLNMRRLSEFTGIKYSRLRSYKCKVIKKLKYNEVELIANYIKFLGGE